MSASRVWFITGASSGFGRALADAAVSRGDRVVATARDAARLTQALHDEVAPFGIRTLIVEPGAFRTGLFRSDAAYQSEAMPEYADTVGPTREYVNGNDGLQPGDPAKAAQAILAALDSDEPPLRLVLGGDAVDNIRSRLDQLTDELRRWEDVGRRTSIEDV